MKYITSRQCHSGLTPVRGYTRPGARPRSLRSRYSNKSRGLRAKEAAAATETASSVDGADDKETSRSSATWAMLIKRVYELDPMVCPQCGGQMTVVAFIEPPQREVIEKILKHCGLWQASSARPPPAAAEGDRTETTGCSPRGLQELTYVDQDAFEASF